MIPLRLKRRDCILLWVRKLDQVSVRSRQKGISSDFRLSWKIGCDSSLPLMSKRETGDKRRKLTAWLRFMTFLPSLCLFADSIASHCLPGQSHWRGKPSLVNSSIFLSLRFLSLDFIPSSLIYCLCQWSNTFMTLQPDWNFMMFMLRHQVTPSKEVTWADVRRH